MQNNKSKGDEGELIATKYLEDKGYVVIKNNFRCTFGEVDIIAKDKDFIVFIEVKYRTNKKFGMPVEAVNKKKQQKIRAVANYYILKNKIKSKVRIDVIGILSLDKVEINHITNAF